MNKLLLLLTFTFYFGFGSISQTASKNEENCQYVISLKPEGTVTRNVSTYIITPLNATQKSDLMTLIYNKSRTTYNISFTSTDEIRIYHLSDVSVQYFIELLTEQGYFIQFESITPQ